MGRMMALLLLIAGTGEVRAQDCPDFYRFVDFGLTAPDGDVYRGGPTFRAESFEGSPLLLEDHTECRSVRETARDGHGNPIPVVTRIHYDPARTGMALAELSLTLADGSTGRAEEAAEDHRARLRQPGTIVTRGPDFLCAGEEGTAAVSCQIVSPYPGNVPLLVYCDADRCAIPAMAIDARIVAGAAWKRPEATRDRPAETGAHASEMAQDIRAFLDPLS